MKVDTHIHSVFSDGTYLPAEIVEIAKNENLGLIALTDHNTIDGIGPFAACARYYGIRVLAGVEITTEFKGKEIHLLSYFPIDSDFRSEKFSGFVGILDGIRRRKAESNRAVIEKISKDYPEITYEGFLGSVSSKSRYSENFNRMHIADYLLTHGIVSDRSEAFSLLKEGGRYYVSPSREDLLETVKTVVKCGGFPTVAHMFEYEDRLSQEDLQDMLVQISRITSEFGVEIFHFRHKPEQIEKYMQMCRNTGADILFMAGSDCHGIKKGKPNKIGYPYDFELGEKYSQLYGQISDRVIEYFTERKFI